MYYLVYKLECNPSLWIVKKDIDLEYIFENHNKFIENKIEKYYVFENNYIENLNNNDFKRFQKFKYSKEYKLLYTLG